MLTIDRASNRAISVKSSGAVGLVDNVASVILRDVECGQRRVGQDLHGVIKLAGRIVTDGKLVDCGALVIRAPGLCLVSALFQPYPSVSDSREVVDIGGGLRGGGSNGQVGEISCGKGLVDGADDGNIILRRIFTLAARCGSCLRLVCEAEDQIDSRQVGAGNLGRVDDETGLGIGTGRKGFRFIRVLGLVEKLETKILRVGVVKQMNLLSLGPVGVDGSGDSTSRHDGGVGFWEREVS